MIAAGVMAAAGAMWRGLMAGANGGAANDNGIGIIWRQLVMAGANGMATAVVMAAAVVVVVIVAVVIMYQYQWI